MRIACWFSCGIASAVATKIALSKYTDAVVQPVRCIVLNEHSDNDRFATDCKKWFDVPIINKCSTVYTDCWDVWTRRKYISGIHGAPCTIEMKKVVRWQFEREWQPDGQVFGYTYEELKRAEHFRQANPEVNLLTPLIDEKLTKADCMSIIQSAEIAVPMMYKLGFKNNNCIGCAKATSIAYWARIRHYFPEQFVRMAELSRKLDCKMTRLKGVRIFLDEIPEEYPWIKRVPKESVDCGILCG